MPFTSKFSAEFAQGLMDNIQAVLESATIGPNAALAVIDNTLDVFVDFDTPTPITINFPALYLEPSTSKIEQSADDAYLKAEHEFLISLAIVGPEPDTLKKRINKYVRAVDQSLRGMTQTSLTGGVTTTQAGAAWEVTQHRYGVLRETENTIYRKDAQLVLVVQLIER